MLQKMLCVLFLLVLCNAGFAQGNDAAFCKSVDAVLNSLNKKGDWLKSLKAEPAKSSYFIGLNYESKIKIPGSLCSYVHQRRENAKQDSGNYYFSAILASRPKVDDELINSFEKLKATINGCATRFIVAESADNKYVPGDAYYSLSRNKNFIELSRYKNSNSNTWVILLTIELKEEDNQFNF